MLETNKTYSWEEFWQYCKIGETYNITLTEDLDERMPILDPNETYFLCLIGHLDEPRMFKATDFISAFKRFANEDIFKQIFVKLGWYRISDFYKIGEIHCDGEYTLSLYENIIYELMNLYGVEDRDTFEEEYLSKLPNVASIKREYGDTHLSLDLEECDYFQDAKDYTITIKEKKDYCKFEVNGKGIEGNGIVGGIDPHFEGIMDGVEVKLNDIR